MNNVGFDGWLVAGFAMNLAGAICCALALIWLWQRGDAERSERSSVLGALAVTAIWCVIAAAYGAASPVASLVESARNLSWFLVVYRLFANDGRHRSMTPIKPVLVALAFVECLHPALFVIGHRFAATAEIRDLTFVVSVLFRILVSIGALVLLHNLYAGASATTRAILRWSAAALAGMWAYDLNLYTIAYLGKSLPLELAAFRGLVTGVVAGLIAFVGNSSNAELRFSPSRAVTFQTLSLLLIGFYLLIMVSLSQSLDFLGGDLRRLTQVGFVFAAMVVALLWLPSRNLLGWLRVTALKHLFQHRYDYRSEWLRFMKTIGRAGADAAPLPERAVQVLADIAESPRGLLLAPDDDGQFELVARWRWDSCKVSAAALPTDLAKLLEAKEFIVDLDQLALGKDEQNIQPILPDWLLACDQAWALIPLVHFDRMLGVVVLARPAVPRSLDWEDFDLLKLVGRQLASYLAEQAGEQALMDASQFDEFNRRIAFVMHDIKNLASQLGLLARNAEKHADKPEFRADMLITLRNSADKLNLLLARLNRYGASASEKRDPFDLAQLAQKVAGSYQSSHSVVLTRKESCTVCGDGDALEQALTHLVQNAIDASGENAPVCLEVAAENGCGRLEIVDSGSGMSAEFIRSGLFRPFVSSKNGGFGIGAFEARELIRSMGGRLEVESREGLGTRFSIFLPQVDAAGDILNETPKNEAA